MKTETALPDGQWSLHRYQQGEPLEVKRSDGLKWTSWDVSIGIGDIVFGTFSGASPGAPCGYPCLQSREAVMAAAQRAVDCVNACQGIADPSKALEMLRKLVAAYNRDDDMAEPLREAAELIAKPNTP